MDTFLFLLCLGIMVYLVVVAKRRRRDAEESKRDAEDSKHKIAALTARLYALEQQAKHAPPVQAEKITVTAAVADAAAVPQATPVAKPVAEAPMRPPAPPPPSVTKASEPPPKPVAPPVAAPIAAQAEVKVTVAGIPVTQRPVEPPPAPAKTTAAAASAGTPTIMPGMQPPVAARVQGPLRVPFENAPTPARSLIDSARLRKPKGVSFEELIGANWLPKIGITIVVIAVAGFTATKWALIPAFGRILMFYALGGGLLGLGIWAERKDKYKVLGRVLIGGGWAISFFTTYAMQHVSTAQIIQSNLLDLVLMMAVAGAMVWHTLKYDSQLVTGLSFLLGFVAVGISHETAFSMSAGAILALGMTVLVVRRQWFELEVFGILASYLNHFFWLYKTFATYGHEKPFPGYQASVLLVLSYWAIFRTSYLVRKVSSKQQEAVSTLAGLLSPILFLTVMKYQSFHPTWAFWFLLTIGAIEFTLGQLSVARRRTVPFQVLSSLGVTLMVIAVPTKYAGSHTLEMLWLAGAEAFLLAGVFTRERLFRHFGGIISFLVAAYLLVWPGGVFTLASRILAGQRQFEPQMSLVLGVVAAVFYLNSHVIGRIWSKLFDYEAEQQVLQVLSFTASLFAVSAIYGWAPVNTVAVLLAVFITLLSWTGKQFRIPELIYQAHWIALVAAVDVCIVGFTLDAGWHTVPERILTFGSVALLLYLSSVFVQRAETGSAEVAAVVYRWAASGLVTLLIALQTPPREWLTAVLWVAFALVLALVSQISKRTEFKWQALVLALLSFCWAIAVNFQFAGKFHGLSYALISVPLIACGSYLLVRWSPIPQTRPAYTWTGTLLLGYLAYREAKEPWIAVAWIALAAILACAARLWKDRALLWQTHLLSAAAAAAALYINLQPAYAGSRLQLATVLVTASVLYALNWLSDIADLLENPRIAQAYSWAGSVLLSFLVWYQLQPTSRSLAWGIFGVALFEIGYQSKSAYLRAQGYIALLSSFVYIFLANFNSRASLFSPPILIVALLAILYFWVYWRLHEKAIAPPSKERKIRIEHLLACLGTATVAALLYFELPADSVAVGYAALIFVLLVVAWRLCLPIFLYQGMVMLVLAAFRLSMYNLYKLSNSSTYDITNATVAILLLAAAIPLAFQIRKRQIGRANPPAVLQFFLSHPEQPLFFVPVLLMAVLLFLRMQGTMIALSWGLEGVVIILAAFFARERSFIRTGLLLLLLCVGRVILDLWRVQDVGVRYLAMGGVGAILVVAGYLFARNREALREYL